MSSEELINSSAFIDLTNTNLPVPDFITGSLPNDSVLGFQKVATDTITNYDNLVTPQLLNIQMPNTARVNNTDILTGQTVHSLNVNNLSLLNSETTVVELTKDPAVRPDILLSQTVSTSAFKLSDSVEKRFNPSTTVDIYIAVLSNFKETAFDRVVPELRVQVDSNTPIRLFGAIENYTIEDVKNNPELLASLSNNIVSQKISYIVPENGKLKVSAILINSDSSDSGLIYIRSSPEPEPEKTTSPLPPPIGVIIPTPIPPEQLPPSPAPPPPAPVPIPSSAKLNLEAFAPFIKRVKDKKADSTFVYGYSLELFDKEKIPKKLPNVELWYTKDGELLKKITSSPVRQQGKSNLYLATKLLPPTKIYINAPFEANGITTVVNLDKQLPEISFDDNKAVGMIPLIVQIPDIMRNLGFEKGANFMERWFLNKGRIAKFKVPDFKIPVYTDVTIDWLLDPNNSKDSRVSEAWEDIIKPDVVFNTASLTEFGKNLSRLIKLNPQIKDYAKLPPKGFTDIKDFHTKHIQTREVISGLFSPIDDIFSAMGSFTFNAVPIAKISTKPNGDSIVTVKGYWVYAIDIYDFRDRGGIADTGELGLWAKPNYVSNKISDFAGNNNKSI
jgi:hypothetical protein